MMRRLTPSGTVLWGRGMMAQLGIDIRQYGAYRPVIACLPEDRRKAVKAARQLSSGSVEEVLLYTDMTRIPSELDGDFIILAGSSELAADFRQAHPQDRRPTALVPLTSEHLESIAEPPGDFLVVDSALFRLREDSAHRFFDRFALSITDDGAASGAVFSDIAVPRAFTYACRTRILVAPGALAELPAILQESGVERPLVLSDKGLTAAGLTDRVRQALDGVDIRVFDDIPPDSDSRVVDRIISLYREDECDGLIAFGGGSVLDTGKGVFLGASTGCRSLTDWAGSGRIPRLGIPFIAVPTTAGTGSEVTGAAVVADENQGRKVLYISNHLQPDTAILDGSLAVGLPPFLTSITGMDALSHSVEAFTCLGKNPLSDRMAWTAIEKIRDNLIPLLDNPGDTAMRQEMTLASSLAGQAFSNSMVGMVHTLGHSVGAVCHAPHGACMSVFLPPSLEYNLSRIRPLLARLLPALVGSDEAAGLSEIQAADRFISRIREMNSILREKTGGRHPETLRHLVDREGRPLVSREQFEEIARTAMGDGSIVYNPRELRYPDILDVLEKAWG